MKIAVFGATGKTGQYVVQQALANGDEVIALVRTPAKLTQQHPKLTIVQGDIGDAKRVEETIKGADAVLSVLGPTNNKPDFAIRNGMSNILKAMQTHGVRRIVISAGAGVRDPHDKPKAIDAFFGFLLKTFSKNVVADMEQTVVMLRASDREWVVVRVPMLTEQPAQGTLKVGYVGDITPRIARADMASFMLKQLKDNTFIGKAPAISN